MIKEIETRQSIRKYLDKPVEKEKIEDLMRAAFRAPSARHLYPQRIIVVQDRKLLDEIGNFDPHIFMFKTATAGLIVCYDADIARPEFGPLDAAASIENILLEAKHIGLDTCWCATRENRVEFLRPLLDIPANWVPVGAVALGYGDEVKPISDNYNPDNIVWK